MSNQLSPADVLKETKARLASFESDLSILRPNEFCERDTFLDDLDPVDLSTISNIINTESSPYQAEYCSRKSEAELLHSINVNSSAALDKAIAYGAVAVKYVKKDDPNRGIVISMFARTLRRRWRITNENKHLDDAIYYFQKTIELEPLDEPNRLLHFDDLGCALRERYVIHRNNEDFNEARAAFENAVLKPFDAAPAFLSGLGRLYKDKASFATSTDEKTLLLEKSLDIHLKAVSSVTPGFKGSMQFIYSNLADAYLALHRIDTVGSFKGEVEERIRPSGNMWLFLYQLGILIGNKYIDNGQKLGSEALESISFLRASLKESPNNRMVSSALAEILNRYGTVINSTEMLTEAYLLNEGLISTSLTDNDEVLRKLQSMSLILVQRFELTKTPEDINKAISLTERALASPLLDVSAKWKFQQILGIQFGCRFQVTEHKDDLKKGISSLKEALAFDGLSDSDKAMTLREYGKLVFQYYKLIKQETDLEEAVRSLETAIELSGENLITKILCINDLATAFLVRFENTGKPEVMQQSIDQFLHGLDLIDPTSPSLKQHQPMFQLGLGNAFFMRYEVWNQAADLNQAISYYRDAVDNTEPSDTRLATRVGSLGRALQNKCLVTNNKKYLEQAQECVANVLASPYITLSPHEVSFLQNIKGIFYMHAFDNSDEDLSLLDAAAECFRLAAQSGCKQPMLINPPIINRIRALMTKYEFTKREEDLQKVVKESPQISTFMKSPNYRELRGMLDTVAKLATLVYDTKKHKQFGVVGMMFYAFVAKDESAFPGRRIWASLQLARLNYEVLNQPSMARDSLVSVLNLLPNAILMCSNRADQLRASKQFSALPGHVASFSLAAGDTPGDALKWFEQGRSIIWNRLINTKTDLTHLREKHEDLASKFEFITGRLNRLDSSSSDSLTATDSPALLQLRQHQLALEYNDTVRIIREKEGFENFLLLDEPSRLAELAEQGSIVVLNSTKYRADAIIITLEGVLSVPLPDFTSDKCIEHGALVLNACRIMAMEKDRASAQLNTVLTWLWHAVAEPVLTKMNMTGAQRKLPRIWWLSNKWTSLFPIHAAGDHARALRTGEACTVMDRAVSSYIPSIRVLHFLRKSAANLSSIRKTRASASAVIVKMPTTPDDIDLPNIEDEVATVEALLKPKFKVISLSLPRRKDVLSLLETASVAHFACHGDANVDDPSLSKLKLQDWKTNPLDVRTLLRASCEHLEFVYLSACETAATTAPGTHEECIHPSAAFQMAGVPYTVASIWKIEDGISARMSSEFYAFLEGDDGVFDFGRSAEALHAASLKMRAKGTAALYWGAFVHFGV